MAIAAIEPVNKLATKRIKFVTTTTKVITTKVITICGPREIHRETN